MLAGPAKSSLLQDVQDVGANEANEKLEKSKRDSNASKERNSQDHPKWPFYLIATVLLSIGTKELLCKF